MGDWLVQNSAEIVLLHVGTNDISNGENVTEVVADVAAILDEIDTYSEDVTVFLARITLRTDDPVLNQTTKDFNNAVNIFGRLV